MAMASRSRRLSLLLFFVVAATLPAAPLAAAPAPANGIVDPAPPASKRDGRGPCDDSFPLAAAPLSLDGNGPLRSRGLLVNLPSDPSKRTYGPLCADGKRVDVRRLQSCNPGSCFVHAYQQCFHNTSYECQNNVLVPEPVSAPPTRRPTPWPTYKPTRRPTDKPTPRPTDMVKRTYPVQLILHNVPKNYRMDAEVRSWLLRYASEILDAKLGDVGFEFIRVEHAGRLRQTSADKVSLAMKVTARGPSDVSDFALPYILEIIREDFGNLVNYLRGYAHANLGNVELTAEGYDPSNLLIGNTYPPSNRPTRGPTRRPTPNPTPWPTPRPSPVPTRWPTSRPTKSPVTLETMVYPIKMVLSKVPRGFSLDDEVRGSLLRFVGDVLDAKLEDVGMEFVKVEYAGRLKEGADDSSNNKNALPQDLGRSLMEKPARVGGRSSYTDAYEGNDSPQDGNLRRRRLESVSVPLKVTTRGPAHVEDVALTYVKETIRASIDDLEAYLGENFVSLNEVVVTVDDYDFDDIIAESEDGGSVVIKDDSGSRVVILDDTVVTFKMPWWGWLILVLALVLCCICCCCHCLRRYRTSSRSDERTKQTINLFMKNPGKEKDQARKSRPRALRPPPPRPPPPQRMMIAQSEERRMLPPPVRQPQRRSLPPPQRPKFVPPVIQAADDIMTEASRRPQLEPTERILALPPPPVKPKQDETKRQKMEPEEVVSPVTGPDQKKKKAQKKSQKVETGVTVDPPEENALVPYNQQQHLDGRRQASMYAADVYFNRGDEPDGAMSPQVNGMMLLENGPVDPQEESEDHVANRTRSKKPKSNKQDRRRSKKGKRKSAAEKLRASFSKGLSFSTPSGDDEQNGHEIFVDNAAMDVSALSMNLKSSGPPADDHEAAAIAEAAAVPDGGGHRRSSKKKREEGSTVRSSRNSSSRRSGRHGGKLMSSLKRRISWQMGEDSGDDASDGGESISIEGAYSRRK